MTKAKQNRRPLQRITINETVIFDRTDAEDALISKAVDRAVAICKKLKVPVSEDNRMNLTMDLAACNASGNPLDFDKLLSFDDFSFMHDIQGISRHLCRTTGKLRDHFLPRSSKREA